MSKRLTAKEIIKVLSSHCFECVSQKGSHQKWKNIETGKITIVPYHQGKQLPPGTTSSIINGSGIPKEEFGF